MKIFLLITLFILQSTQAKEVSWLGRSVKGQLMGDAWTALSNDDGMTLFYNPASLGANYAVNFHPINAKFGVTNALSELDRFQNFPSGDAAGIADRLLGFPVFIEASTFPTLKMLHMSFSLLATSNMSLVLKNKVHPILDINYTYDRGFVTGFAFNLIGSDFSKGKKINSDTRLSIGYSLKHINREGLDHRFDLFGTGILDDINNGSFGSVGDIKKTFGLARGKAFGHDIGIEFATGAANSEIIFSSSILDVGTTRFKKTEKSDTDVPVQEMLWSAGMAFKQEFGIMDYALTMDFKPINLPIPLARKFHFGVNLNLPLISFFGGWSEGYLSYGGELRLFPFALTVGFYSVELGNEFKENEGKRAFVYLSLFDASFDIF